VVDGEISELVGTKDFVCKSLGWATLPAKDQSAMLAFQKDVSEFSRIVRGTSSYLGELSSKLEIMAVAVKEAPDASEQLLSDIKKMEQEIAGIRLVLSGDGSMSKRSYPTSPSISGRVGSVVYGILETSSAPTETMKQSLKVAEEMFADVYPKVKTLGEQGIPSLEDKLEKAGAPYTQGRLPEWK
jgi:hypothetical protein